MDAISSLCNDIISYMATTPSSHSLSSLDIQAATFGSLFSSDAHRSLWATKQNGVSWTTVLDGCSEVSEVREVSEVSPLQELDAENHCQRYKTELCRPFEESGFCRYGNRCQFAHGKQELRTVDRHPKYKTQLCKTFHTTGLCRYGKRCHFIHNEDEGADAHRLIPQQQQPMSGLRKLIGRQNVESVEEQRMRACSILPASVPLASSRRYAEGLSSPVSSGMSLPSSAASSPSPSLTSFSDDAFSSSAASEFSQIPNLCKASTSPYSSFFYSTDLFSHPSSIPSSACTDYSPALPPKAIVFSRDDDDARSQGDDVFDAVLRHLTKAQIQRLLLEYLLEKEKRNPSV